MTEPSEEWPFGEMGTVVGDWVDALSGLRCLALVGPLGSLCGYVEVPESHPWFGHDQGDDDVTELDVHGGITYAGPGPPLVGDEWADGPPPDWWFGFDCAHLGDYVPRLRQYRQHFDLRSPFGEVLRAPEWVGAECTRLAHQLAAVWVVTP